MALVLIAAGILPLTAMICLLVPEIKTPWHRWVYLSGPVLSAIFFSILALPVLSGGSAVLISWPSGFFQGSFVLELDALSAIFILPIVWLSVLSAFYGSEYLKHHAAPGSTGKLWFSFHILVFSMILVVLSRNALLFLLSWELMSLSSFLLVITENKLEEVRRAGWIYLVATHIGTACLIVFFLLMAGGPGLDFSAFQPMVSPSICFTLALIGFGTKAGIMPLHGWLPEAHPAAPSHVSALMSGVMIKTGIYGLIRTILLLGNPPVSWGITLIVLGSVSGILGILFALAEHDLKRLLAYCSVENIGIILLGVGLGTFGMSIHNTPMMVLGFAGGILHVLNHAISKSLLFFGAGVVIGNSGTRQLDQLGGRLRQMPFTGTGFLVGSVAISGLPPLNGFVSEFLIFMGALAGLRELHSWFLFVPLSVIISLAAIGGLAVACFIKAFGIVFLGEARNADSQHEVHEAGGWMILPILILAFFCLVLGLGGGFVVQELAAVLGHILAVPADGLLGTSAGILKVVAVVFSSMIACSLILMVIRRNLIKKRKLETQITWDCGYEKPTARMQYTASSFAKPITDLFGLVLRSHTESEPPLGYFPDRGFIHTEAQDTWNVTLYKPLYLRLMRTLEKFLALQQGRTHLYLLYIIVMLLLLLSWWGVTE